MNDWSGNELWKEGDEERKIRYYVAVAIVYNKQIVT